MLAISSRFAFAAATISPILDGRFGSHFGALVDLVHGAYGPSMEKRTLAADKGDVM
jgi:hypothetical protein